MWKLGGLGLWPRTPVPLIHRTCDSQATCQGRIKVQDGIEAAHWLTVTREATLEHPVGNSVTVSVFVSDTGRQS
jgi:hypothetical protein